MAIPVTCPSCLTRFNVSDQYAGKSGPCPKCRKPIKIPEKSEEVVIHAPAESGPKDSKGRSVLKPLRRKEVSLSLPVILGAGLTALVIFGIAYGLGQSGREPGTTLLGIGAIVLAVPIVLLGYWFLHDDELEGFQGRQLFIRCGVCAAAFAASWGLYAFIPAYLSGYNSMSEITGLEMVIFVALMIALGTVASVLSLELEIVQGLTHYMFYFGITFILAWLAGTQLSGPLSSGEEGRRNLNTPSAVTRPAPTPNTPATPQPSNEIKVPKLLQ